MSTEAANVSKTITAQNTYTDELAVLAGERVDISIQYATAVATTRLERKFTGQSDFNPVPNEDGSIGWTASTEQQYIAGERCVLRLGVPTGGYTSGTVTARLGKG